MPVGIVGYGAYIPCYRTTVQDIAAATNHDVKKITASLAIKEKSIPGSDEDAITIGVEASKNALLRAGIAAQSIDAVYVGSESHPYVVKPSSTIIAAACGIKINYKAADLEFACKGGTAALQVGMSMVKAGMATYALAVGTDTAQANPQDILAYSAGAGGASFIVGTSAEELLATIDDTLSLSSETPDFWRRSLQKYPEHVGRFTAEPGYFSHVQKTTQAILQRNNLQPADCDYVVFHQPNGRFPVVVAHRLGFTKEQYQDGLLVSLIGNTYSGSSLLGLTAVLDIAKPHQKILLVSYGSGSGCDAFILTTTPALAAKQQRAPTTGKYISRKRFISYATYRRHCDLVY